MITRLPSYQHEYTEHWSYDSALVRRPTTPPDEAGAESKAAHEKAVEDYERKLRIARETGNWQPLILDGQSPTPFVMGQVDRNIWRAIRDRLNLRPGSPGWIGIDVGVALLFRLAIQRIVGLDLEVSRRADSRWEGWTMAQPELVSDLDTKYHPGIVTELGDQVFVRLRGLSPL
jgi:hypothetical protein